MEQLNSKGNKRGMHHNHARGENNFNFKHGMMQHPMYTTWTHIRYRCSDPNYKQWINYGGRDVTLSEEFQEFGTFLEYMMELGWYKGCHISRKNDIGNYERGNVEVKTPEENRREMNSRKYVAVRNIDLNMTFEHVYRAAEYIKEKQGLTSKLKTIAENIRCKGLQGSVSYGYSWEVMPNASKRNSINRQV